MEVDSEDVFPFSKGVIFRFQPLNFRWSKEFSIGCTNRTVHGVSCDVQKPLFLTSFLGGMTVCCFFSAKNPP